MHKTHFLKIDINTTLVQGDIGIVAYKSMRKIFLILGICLFFLSISTSCSTNKNAQVQVSKGVSMANYPYIEKFHEGLRLKSKGEIDNSIACFNYCLSVRQNDDAVYYALSQLYLQKKDLAKSATSIQAAAKLSPENIWYTQELAYMYFENGKLELAVKEFEKLVKKQPANVDWLYGLAECYVKVGKIGDAIKALDRTEEQVGMHPELTIQKFNLYVKMKQPEKGIEEINRARVEFPKEPQLLGALVDYYFQTNQSTLAIEMLEKLVESDPENGRAHLGLADIYRQQRKKKESLEELKEGFVCSDVTIDDKMKILISIQEEPTKPLPEVYELVSILVEQHPTDSKAHSIQGDFYLRAEKNEQALVSYKKALKYDKSKFPIWNQVLLMEYQARKFDDLFVDSKECISLFPSSPTIYLLYSVSANQLRKFSEAIEAIEIGNELVVNDKVLESELYSQLGEAYFGLKKITDAKVSYEKALVLDPLSTLIMNNFAYRLALEKVDLLRAEELIKKANLAAPNKAHFMDTYGWVLFQKGEFAKAKVLYEQAYEQNPTDKIIVEHMGDVYLKEGNIEKAVEFWKKAKFFGATNRKLDLKIEKKEYYDPVY